RSRQALFNTPQNQPQGRDYDLLLRIVVMRDHARRIPSLPRDADDGGLVETVLRNDAASDECDLIAALIVIDNLRHKSPSLSRHSDATPLLSWRRQSFLRRTNLIQFRTHIRIHGGSFAGVGIDVQIHLLARRYQDVIATTMQCMKQVDALFIHSEYTCQNI